MIKPLWKSNWPPIFPALLAQLGAFLFLLLLLFTFNLGGRIPLWLWPCLQGILASLISLGFGLHPWWYLFQMGLPLALAWQMGNPLPVWLFPTLVLILLLIFGGGLWSRVPLYNSNRSAWQSLETLIPPSVPFRMADLGAGLGGPLAYLAQRHPKSQFVGIEASPLVWLAAWVRTWRFRKNCRIRLGSFWSEDLSQYDLVYAFLSPVPMPALWEKARSEMPSGSLFVSHTFEIPGVQTEAIRPLQGRSDACLRIYRIP